MPQEITIKIETVEGGYMGEVSRGTGEVVHVVGKTPALIAGGIKRTIQKMLETK